MPKFFPTHTESVPLSGPERAYNYRHDLDSLLACAFPSLNLTQPRACAPSILLARCWRSYVVGLVDVLLRMHKRSCLLLALTVLLHAWEGVWAEARFTGGFQMKDGVDVPISSEPGSRLVRRGPTASGESPLGNNVDMCVSFCCINLSFFNGGIRLYTIPLVLGNEVYAVHLGMFPLHLLRFSYNCLDTGSSDLWVISDQCRTNACAEATSRRYPSSSFNSTQRAIELSYGDSTGSSSARGTIGREKASVAGLAMAGQPFALVDDTTNPVVRYGVSGLFGMGFPSSRYAAHPYVPVNGEMTPSKQNPEDLGANLSQSCSPIQATVVNILIGRRNRQLYQVDPLWRTIACAHDGE